MSFWFLKLTLFSKQFLAGKVVAFQKITDIDIKLLSNIQLNMTFPSLPYHCALNRISINTSEVVHWLKAIMNIINLLWTQRAQTRNEFWQADHVSGQYLRYNMVTLNSSLPHQGGMQCYLINTFIIFNLNKDRCTRNCLAVYFINYICELDNAQLIL